MKPQFKKTRFKDLSIFLLEGVWQGKLLGLMGTSIRNTFEIDAGSILGRGLLQFTSNSEIPYEVKFDFYHILMDNHQIKMKFLSYDREYYGTQVMEINRNEEKMVGHYNCISQKNHHVICGQIILKKSV